MAPFCGRSSNASMLKSLWEGSLLFTTKFPEIPQYSFYQPWKYERLSWPWSHPVALNTGPQDLESSTLTTRPLLQILKFMTSSIVQTRMNKNLLTHFVWYLEKEKRFDIETLPIDIVLNKENFYGKIMQKISTKSYIQTPFWFW